jgi:dihydrofolate reductase
MTSPIISIIVAMGDAHVIGINNDLPWHVPEDLKHFKNLTTGKPVIMGRKTFESILSRINKPLPNRKTIVVSRSGFEYAHDDVSIVESLDAAFEKARDIAAALNVDEIMIAGGAQIYAQSLPYATRLHITKVDISVEGDAWFPTIDKGWVEVSRTSHTENTPAFHFITYGRN